MICMVEVLETELKIAAVSEGSVFLEETAAAEQHFGGRQFH
jgi:hypothetical protein